MMGAVPVSSPGSPVPPRDLDPVALRAAVAGALGTRVVALARTASTMNDARRLADDGAAHGTVVVADYQSAGRGRFRRPWVAPPGSALLMSVVLRPGHTATLAQIPAAFALGALTALENLPGLGAIRLALKWPNDIVTAGSGLKIGGVLAETTGAPGPSTVTLVGVGLNLTAPPESLPAGATSLAAAAHSGAGDSPAGSEALVAALSPRWAVAAAVLDAASTLLAVLEEGGSIVPTWRARLTTLGQAVAVRAIEGAVPIHGGAVDITDDGALVVETSSGRRHVVHAGDVTLAPMTEKG